MFFVLFPSQINVALVPFKATTDCGCLITAWKELNENKVLNVYLQGNDAILMTNIIL